jgi:hypothetical protein
MFGLALQLGMTVGEIQQRMSAREFSQWLAFFELRAQKNTPERELASQWFQIEE